MKPIVVILFVIIGGLCLARYAVHYLHINDIVEQRLENEQAQQSDDPSLKTMREQWHREHD